MKKFLAILLALCASVFFVFAGGQQEGKADEGSKTITLEFWHAKTDADMQEFFDAYTETHPNVKIKQTVFVDDDYKTQSRIALAGGETPDVWYMNTGSALEQFVNSGGLMDLTPYIKKYGWDETYDATALSCSTVDGKLYGLPWTQYTPWMVLFANKDFFEEHNLAYPKTVDDLVELAPKIRALGQEPLVFYNKDGWTGAILFGDFMLQQVGPEWIEKINNGEIKWTESKEAKASLGVLRRLAQEGVLLTGYETMRQDTALPIWKNEQSPLMYNGTWFTQNIGSEFDFEVETLRLPRVTEGAEPKGYQNWLDWALGISPDTKNLEAALEFITYAAGPGLHYIEASKTGNFTPTPEINDKIEAPYYFKTEPILEQLDKPKTPFWCYAFPTEVNNTLQEQIKLVMAGNVTADQALKTIQTVQEQYQ
jgi:raffinose/stachyose/melibiose transport system substrate-binding protein